MTSEVAAIDIHARAVNRRRAKRKITIGLLRAVVCVGLLAAWQAAADLRLVNPFFASSPAEIAARLFDLFEGNAIWHHLGITLYEASVGFVLGSVSGILLGLLFARFALLNSVVGPLMMALNSLPRIALVSLFVLWFGIGANSKIALVWSLVVFTMFVNTYGGATNVDPDLLSVTKLLGASQRQIMVKLILPSSIPWIFSGLRLSAALALTGAIVGEMIVAQYGLGFLISSAAATYDTGRVMAVLVVVAVVATILNWASEHLERYLMGRPDNRQTLAWGG